MTTFAERLVSDIGTIDDVDQAWVQYVKDHRSLLLDKATIERIEPNIMFTYRHRMPALLERLKYSASLTWIVMWLNQLNSPADVVGLTELIIPDKNQIEELSRDYASFQLKIVNLDV